MIIWFMRSMMPHKVSLSIGNNLGTSRSQVKQFKPID